MLFALGFLLRVIGGGPGRVIDGLVGPFDEGLAEETGSTPAPVDPFMFAAFLGDGGDAAEFLEVAGGGVTVALGAESDEEAGTQSGSGARKMAKEVGFGMHLKDEFDFLLIAFDAEVEFGQLLSEEAAVEDTDGDDGLIGGQGSGVGNTFQTFFNGVRAANVVGMIEGADGVGSGGFEGDEVGPFEEEGAGQWAEDILADEFEGLREIGFEEGGQGVGQLGAQIHGRTAGLNEAVEFAGLDVIGMPGQELVAMDLEEIEQELGIWEIVLGAGGIEGLAIKGAGFGIDGIEGDEFDMEQGMDERPVFGFEGDGDGPAAEALAQVGNPVLKGFGGVREVEFFDGGATLDLESAGMSLITPVQADEGSVVSHNDSSVFLVLESAQSV